MSGLDNRMPVAVLISGRGTNMRALVERSGDPHMGYRVAAVISDQPEAAGLATAAALGIAARALPAPGRGARSRSMSPCWRPWRWWSCSKARPNWAR